MVNVNLPLHFSPVGSQISLSLFFFFLVRLLQKRAHTSVCSCVCVFLAFIPQIEQR